jgi:hypothetical protein
MFFMYAAICDMHYILQKKINNLRTINKWRVYEHKYPNKMKNGYSEKITLCNT